VIRRLFTVASALSLLLCALAVALWVYSYRLPDTIVWERKQIGQPEIHAVPGGFYWWVKVGIERVSYSEQYWQIVLLTLVVPLWPVIRRVGKLEAKLLQNVRRWLEMDRRASALCRRCGYDLRASKDRCPECGTTISPNAVSPEQSGISN
jgi:hypothetical protein